MLPLQPRVSGPWRPSGCGDWSLVQVPAIEYAYIEATGKVVHVDSERRVGDTGEGRNWLRLKQREEVRSDVDGSDENRTRNEEDNRENEEENSFPIHFQRSSATISLSTVFFQLLTKRLFPPLR